MTRAVNPWKPPVAFEPLEGRSLLSAAALVIDEVGPRPPVAFLAPDEQQPNHGRVRGGAGPHVFAIAFDDDARIDEASVRDNAYAVRVVGPNDYEAAPRLVGTGAMKLSEFDFAELY